MENEVENTVEDMQQDNNAIKQMRERIKELESVEKEYKSVQMANAIKDAGFDPDTGAGKALKDLYKGELQADAIKAFCISDMVGVMHQQNQPKKNCNDKELFLVKTI